VLAQAEDHPTLAITRPQNAYGYTEVDGGGSGAWQC
jgi:hypothetical protein